jgi:hypothetical protein
MLEAYNCTARPITCWRLLPTRCEGTIPFSVNVLLEYIVPTVLWPCLMYNLHNVFEYLAIVSTKGIVKSSSNIP